MDIAIIQSDFRDIERNGLPYLKSRVLIIDVIDPMEDDKLVGVPMDALSSDGILFVKETVNINHPNIKNYFSYKNTNHLMQLFQKIKI